MVVIVDYGMGNLGAIANMLKRLGVPHQISADAGPILTATGLILPGVGHFDAAVRNLESSGLRPVLERKALEERVPVLGICLGMQLMTRASEEGTLPGLGWVPARTLGFRDRIEAGLKVPHMGWNEVRVLRANPLVEEAPEPARYYFVHSYFVEVDDPAQAILETTHGRPFHAALQAGNLYGVQFHPEKSHRFGLQLLRNFAALT